MMQVRQQEQRTRILEAAARIIADRGYHGMSMRDLAKATGKSLSAFYNYFASKEEVLFTLQKEAFETLIGSSNEALSSIEKPNARLYVFISHHVRYFADHPEVMRVLVHEAASLPAGKRRTIRRLKERYFEIARGILAELLEKGCGDSGAAGCPPEDEAELERMTYSLFGMLNWIYGWYDPAAHGGPQLLARTIHGMILCGVVTRCPFKGVQDQMEAHLESFESPPLLGHIPLQEKPA